MFEKTNIQEVSKSAVEIIEIMKHAPLEARLKYPYKYRKYFKNVSSKDYVWKYDTNKKLNEQNMSNLTKNILVYMYKNVFNNNKNRRK